MTEPHAAAQPTPEESSERPLRRRVPVIVGLTSVILAFGLGLVITLRGGMIGLDEAWMQGVLDIRGPLGDVIAFGMDRLGGGFVGVFVLPGLTVIVLLILRRPWGAGFAMAAMVGSAVLVQLLKTLFGRARPTDILVNADYGSFPSGHVANAATLAIILGVLVPYVWVWIAGGAYTLLMMASRTYLGAHWLTDTIGGLLVGGGAGLLVWALFAVPLERERVNWRPPFRRLESAK